MGAFSAWSLFSNDVPVVSIDDQPSNTAQHDFRVWQTRESLPAMLSLPSKITLINIVIINLR